MQVSTFAADWRLEHGIRVSALIAEGVIEFVKWRDVLVGSRVVSAPHPGAGVEKLAEAVYQHLGVNTMLLTSAVSPDTDHASAASSRGPAKHDLLGRPLTHQSGDGFPRQSPTSVLESSLVSVFLLCRFSNLNCS